MHLVISLRRVGEIDLGIAGRIGGHDTRVVQWAGNLADVGASPVELRIHDGPGAAMGVACATSLNPSVGMIQRPENQVRAMPEEVTEREARLISARQKTADARETMKVPFKHQDALEAARWDRPRAPALHIDNYRSSTTKLTSQGQFLNLDALTAGGFQGPSMQQCRVPLDRAHSCVAQACHRFHSPVSYHGFRTKLVQTDQYGQDGSGPGESRQQASGTLMFPGWVA